MKDIFQVGTVFDESELEAIRIILNAETSLNRGREVEDFETEFSRLQGVTYSVAVSSATAAIRIALQLLKLDIQPGIVLVQINSFWNTIVALLEFKCTLVFVDCETNSLSISTSHLEQKIELSRERPRAILVTEFGGHPSDYSELKSISERKGIPIISDSAHAITSRYDGRQIAKIADFTCYSFSTLKNISTLGEGGMLCVKSENHYKDALRLRESWPIAQTKAGSSRLEPYFKNLDEYHLTLLSKFLRPGNSLTTDYIHPCQYGSNFKMTSVQAAIGAIQLTKLDKTCTARKLVAQRFSEELKDSDFIAIEPRLNSESSWHLYNIVSKKRDLHRQLKTLEKISNVLNTMHVNRYWPAADLPAVRMVMDWCPTDCPNYLEIFFGRLISLPINPKMTNIHIEKIIYTLKSC